MKASRALFSIKQSIFDKSVKPSLVLHIFDALVKPIALYNSEIWSAYKPCLRGKTVDEMFELTLKNTNEFDKSKRKAMNRNWYNQKANPALNTKAGNK